MSITLATLTNKQTHTHTHTHTHTEKENLLGLGLNRPSMTTAVEVGFKKTRFWFLKPKTPKIRILGF